MDERVRLSRQLRDLVLLNVLLGSLASVEVVHGEVAPTRPAPALGAHSVLHYAPEDYGGGAQVWRAASDSEGLLYFVDQLSLIQFDGARWLRFPAPTGRILEIDRTDRIHVLGRHLFGYFIREHGTLRFVSLIERLAETGVDVGHGSGKGLGQARAIVLDGDSVFYATDRLIVELDASDRLHLRLRHETDVPRRLFAWNDALYVAEPERGLFRLGADGLAPVPLAEASIGRTLVSLVPWDDDSALILSQDGGVFRLMADGASTAWPLDVGTSLGEHRVHHALRMSDGNLLVSTRRGGAAILDPLGRLHSVFDRQRYRQVNNTVYHAHEDRQGNLWLSTDFGIVRVPRAPFRLAIEPSSIDGTLHRVLRHRGRLYVGTRTNLYRLVAGRTAGEHRWIPVDGVDSGAWFLLSVDDDLMVATLDGVLSLRDDGGSVEVTSICPHATVMLYRSRHLPGRVLAATSSGFRVLFRDGEAWQCGEPLPGIDHYVYEAADGPDGELVLRTSENELYVVDLAAELATAAGRPGFAPPVHRHPMPRGDHEFFEADEAIWLSSLADGIFRYRGLAAAAAGEPFRLDPTFDGLRREDAGYQIVVHYEPAAERFWIETDGVLEVAERSPTGEIEHRRVAADLVSYWCDIYRDTETGLYWLTNSSGAFLWDPEPRRRGPPPRTLLRRVVRLPEWTEVRRSAAAVVLPYRENALRFEFAVPVFDQSGASEYQVYLEGFDSGWSPWTTETAKEYINLREGPYRFRVRARDRWNQVAEEASLGFSIEPPAYRSLGAYGVYVLVFGGVLALALRVQRRSLARSLARERAISERLREVDRLKDEFLAKTSHELRTPLHGITGLAESLIDGAAGDTSEAMDQNLGMIAASGRRLGHLVNDILDFSKLRHESLELDRRPVDVHALTEVVLALSRPLIGSRRLALRNEVPLDLPAADGDEDRLQQILFNLVGNAVKFTESGTVTVTARIRQGRLVVEVRDTGIGIAEDQQERIFDAFEQADGTMERQYGGTGLGLAVTQRLVALHGGRLWVRSELGDGSTFGFDLALASASTAASTRHTPVLQPRGASSSGGQAAWRGLPSSSRLDASVSASDDAAPRILVVDDEPVNLQVLSNYFHGEGFDLTLATNGPDALRHLADQRFDLVLLDVMMPKMSGYEVCKQIRQTYPVEVLPVLFLSAMNRSEERIAGLDHGGNDFLSKPVARGELIARVNVHLALLATHREQEQEVRSLRGLLPICMTCKKIRDDEGYWNQMEVYISERTDADFSHGICPTCAEQVLGDLKRSSESS